MPIFVSHSGQDQALYSAVCVALEASGVARWDPTTMLPGESLADQLRAAIEACKVCVFIATPRSLQSTWCLTELGAFWGARKKIFLFVADPDVSDSGFPPQFKGDLRVTTAQELIRVVRTTADDDDIKWPQSSYYYGAGKTLRMEDVFQDFQIVDRAQKGNINTVQYMWADTSAKGSRIEAHVDTEQRCLNVSFNNAQDAYPCNIAIRGREDRPLRNRPRKDFLVFSARLIGDSPSVSIAVRVVDGFLRHWTCGTGAATYNCKTITTTAWKRMHVALNDRAWHRFESDGNPEGPREPDFECICSVVLEIGSKRGSRPGEGPGALAIGPLVLLNHVGDYDKYRACESEDEPRPDESA